MKASSIDFILNDSVFRLPCSRKVLMKIPESKEELFNVLVSKHQYLIQSKVRNETFQSFLNYWKEDIFPQISFENIIEYYQLYSEFGLLENYFTEQKLEDPLFNLSYLINSEQTSNSFKSSIERNLSLHLDDCITDFSDKLICVDINSLYNIFYHNERKLNDHDKAYQFIVNAAAKKNKDFYIFIESLDAQKFKVFENLNDAFLNKNNHCGFFPKNMEPVFDNLTKLNKNYESQLNELKEQNKNNENQLNGLKENNISINAQLDNFKKQNENLESQLNESNQQVKNYVNQMNDLKEKNKNLESQLNESNQKNKNLESQLNESNQQVKNYVNQMNDLKEKNKNLESQLNESNQKNKNLESQLNKSKQQNKNYENQLNDLKEKNKNLENRLDKILNPPVYTFKYIGMIQKVDLIAGRYKLEVWGAQGGSYDSTYYGGKGGYSTGEINLSKDTSLYVYVGGKGDDCNVGINGGWNGGGSIKNSYRVSRYGGGGGGSTDISLYGTENSDDWNNTNHLYSRIIVAGGGSSASYGSGGGNSCGGFGGGESGGGKLPASQTSAGTNGSFGVGANEEGEGHCPDGAAGGGWYGGGSFGLQDYYKPSGGGSGYVFTSSTRSNYPSGCLLNSSLYLENASTKSGDTSFPNFEGNGNETGHSGNGAAKISLLQK